MTAAYVCPVCGFPDLEDPPWTPEGGGSYEICSSCGFEFGVTDDDAGYSYSDWRERWISTGMKWHSIGIVPVPQNWDPAAQVAAVRH